MIKNVVFDLGNVLLTFNPMEYLKSKLNDDKLAEKIYNVIFKSDEWIMYIKNMIFLRMQMELLFQPRLNA